jgi:hypothetical protein
MLHHTFISELYLHTLPDGQCQLPVTRDLQQGARENSFKDTGFSRLQADYLLSLE